MAKLVEDKRVLELGGGAALVVHSYFELGGGAALVVHYYFELGGGAALVVHYYFELGGGAALLVHYYFELGGGAAYQVLFMGCFAIAAGFVVQPNAELMVLCVLNSPLLM